MSRPSDAGGFGDFCRASSLRFLRLGASTRRESICYRAGYGLRHDPPSRYLIAWLGSAFTSILDHMQNAAINRLFDPRQRGKLRAVIVPYLGQDDSRLRVGETAGFFDIPQVSDAALLRLHGSVDLLQEQLRRKPQVALLFGLILQHNRIRPRKQTLAQIADFIVGRIEKIAVGAHRGPPSIRLPGQQWSARTASNSDRPPARVRDFHESNLDRRVALLHGLNPYRCEPVADEIGHCL
jgi:hypothetical protein